MDWNRPSKLIRPNPDWEEDLYQSCVLGPTEEARIKLYTSKYKKRKPKKECSCHDLDRPGVAPLLTLSNGKKIPNMGLGTWLGYDDQGIPIPVTDNAMQHSVEIAIDAGYRLIDTSPRYRVEDQIGKAIKHKISEGVVRREDLFIITKLPNSCHAKEAVIPALKNSLAQLELDYVDLYLIHWPMGIDEDGTFNTTDYLETWQGMVEARIRGLSKAIGLSNFNEQQIDRILSLSAMKPAALQIEVTLNLQQQSLIKFCRCHDIAVIAHTPLGFLLQPRWSSEAFPPHLDSPSLNTFAIKYHKTVPQIALRYLIEIGVIPIPKSLTPEYIRSNIEIFDFHLTKGERQIMKTFEQGHRKLPVEFWREHTYYPFKQEYQIEQ